MYTDEAVTASTDEDTRSSTDMMMNELIQIHQQQDVTALRALIARNPSLVETRNPQGWLPLQAFAFSGWADGIQALLENGADVNAWKAGDETPLHLAVKRNHLPVVRLLMQAGAEGHALDEHGYMPVDIAVERQQWGVIEYLPTVYPVIFDVILRSALGDLAELLQSGACVTAYRPIGTLPLHWAIMCRRADMAQALIAAGAEVNAPDIFGRTPLHLAPDEHLAEVLVNHGADVNRAAAYGQTPLYAVARRAGSLSLAHYLLARGAKVDAHTNWGETPLSTAAFNAPLEMLYLFIAYGANVNHQTDSGATPLHMALCGGQADKIRLLIEHGADPLLPDAAGTSARALAAQDGNTDIIALIDALLAKKKNRTEPAP